MAESVPLGEIADVSVREAPEMIRNDNGELAGYIYVYLDGVTAPEYVDRARAFLAEQADDSRRATPWSGPGCSRTPRTPGRRCGSSCRSRWLIMFGLLVMAFRSVADSSLIMLSAPFALVGGVFLQWYSGLLDDDGRHHRLCVAVRRRDSDRHHHDRVHPRGARAAVRRPSPTWMRSSKAPSRVCGRS